MLTRGQGGSALLLVVGATAALAAMSLAMLSASLLSYEIAVAEQHGALARLLAASGRDLFETELLHGAVVLPIDSGLVWEPPLPAPPPGFAALPDGCRVEVRVSLVVGVDGPQQWEVFGVGSTIFDAEAEAWCGQGYARAPARYARIAGGVAVRLY